MKIVSYGALPEPAMWAEAVRHIPEDAKDVVIKSHARLPLGIRPCQHPGVLFMEVSIDNKLFLHLQQDTVDAAIVVKKTQ
jgi:hypothetical protein